jgi:hypothetical protein
LTITGSKDIDINSISSTDSTAIQINDGLNVSGTLTANSGLVANGITYPTTDGTPNQVLATNGTGTLSFTSLNSFAGITFVGDDSTGSTINTAETLKFTGSNNITTTVIDDTVTITGSKDINVNSISSGDSSAIQINDAVNVSGVITGGSNVIASQNLISNNSSGDEGGEILLAKPQTNSTIAGTGVTLDIWQNRLRFFEQGGTARGYYVDITEADAGVGSKLATKAYVDGQIIAAGSGTVTSITAGTGLTGGTITTTGTIALDFSTVVARIVGDDSTGTDLRVGETIKIAGAGGITTAVSGDTLTITGANQAQGITFFDDASTSTAIPDGGALQITSGEGIDTAIVGNVLTITNTSTQLEIDGGSAYSIYNAISEALIDGGTA